MKIKFTEEELERYQEFLDSDLSKSVLLRLSALLSSFEKNVLSIDLSSPNSERELLIRKAELQGAQKLFKAFEADTIKATNKGK